MKTRLLAVVLAAFSVTGISAAEPGPPQNLAASVEGNTVRLTWQAPISGDTPTHYVVDAAFLASCILFIGARQDSLAYAKRCAKAWSVKVSVVRG